MSRMNISRRRMSALFLGFLFTLSDPFSDGKVSADAMGHKWWNGSNWGGWESLSGVIQGRPECVSWGADRIDCFAVGARSCALEPERDSAQVCAHNAMRHKWYGASGWGGWEPLGGAISEQPSCVSWGANRIDCFARWHLPVTGPDVPELSGLDDLMVNWMNKYGAKAATLAVLKDRKLVYERGFGYQDKNLTSAILPNARMRLATQSIIITVQALRQLMSDGLVKGDEPVFQVLNLQPWGGGTYADPRMQKFTIQHLIDRQACIAEFLPNKDVGELMGLGRSATSAERLSYAWSQPTMMVKNCTVGASDNFSHFAMEFAGQVIATRANPAPMSNDDYTIVGQRYGDYINSKVGRDFFQARNSETEALPKEIWYMSQYNVPPEWNRKSDPGVAPVSGAYAIDFFARPGSGTVVAAGRDVARYLKNYWLVDGTPKPASLAGINSDPCNCTGALAGTTSVIVDQVWPTGASRSFVVLVNMRNGDQSSDGQQILTNGKDTSADDIANSIRSYLDGVTAWPTIDLF
jgi:hypothetical protein